MRSAAIPVDAAAPADAGLYVKQEVDLKTQTFVIGGGVPGGEVSWQVTGIRNDAYIKAHPVEVEVPKTSHSEPKRGTCLFAPACDTAR